MAVATPAVGLVARLEFRASDSVRAAIAGLGRVEDVRFSPSNHLLAMADFGGNRILLLRIQILGASVQPVVAADDFLEIASDGIRLVHGLDFIDESTLVVANRDARVSIIEIPPGELAGRRCEVVPVREVRGGFRSRVKSPGSVTVRREPGGPLTLLVCNNYANRVTRHVLDAEDAYRVVRNRVLLRRGLNVPDGVALSHDGEWLAVSSHGTHDVKLFALRGPLDRRTTAAGVLRKVNYPHGVCFTADDRHILVADAGAPVIHTYGCGEGWGGRSIPVRSAVVLDDETFARGRTDPREGGPKGLDIDRTGQVVAVACEEQPLAFFKLASIIGDR